MYSPIHLFIFTNARIFNLESDWGFNDILIDAVCHVAEHGITSRMPLVGQALVAIARATGSGFRPESLHRMLETLLLIHPHAPTSLSSIISLFMQHYDDQHQTSTKTVSASQISSQLSCSFNMMEEMVESLVHDVVEGIEIRRQTEEVVNCVRARPSIYAPHFVRDLIWSCERFVSSRVEQNLYQILVTMSRLALSQPHPHTSTSGNGYDGVLCSCIYLFTDIYVYIYSYSLIQ